MPASSVIGMTPIWLDLNQIKTSQMEMALMTIPNCVPFGVAAGLDSKALLRSFALESGSIADLIL